MGKVTIRQPTDEEWRRTADTATGDTLARYGEGALSGDKRTYFPQGPEQLQLFEVRFPAGVEVRPHAHTSAEIILVTGGELQLGARRCGPGTAIYIDEHTLYGFRTGPAGASFLNFRPSPTTRYLTKDELLADRETKTDPPAGPT